MSDPQRKIRLWLQGELAKRAHGTKGRLAAFLGVRADAITRMANTDPRKESREIRAHELQLMHEFFSTEFPAEKIRDPAKIRAMIASIHGLLPHHIDMIVSNIELFQKVTSETQEHIRSDDQHEKETLLRASQSTR